MERIHNLLNMLLWKITDALFATWSSFHLSHDAHVVLLTIVTVSGYHGMVTYQWSKDGYRVDEVHPILYTQSQGLYVRLMTSREFKATKSFMLLVMGTRKQYSCQLISCTWVLQVAKQQRKD